jgi:hypothetical protein
MTAQTTTTPPARDVRRFELTLTILGAVCSAVVTGVLAAGNVSTTGKLLGMALGAALPPLVGAVGPGRPLRVAVAVVLTAGAVVIGYGGGQIFAKVSGTEPPLPTPNQIVTSLGGDDGGGDGDGGGGDGGGGGGERTADALVQREGDLGIHVDPGVIRCGAEAACGPVTVTSVGTAPLRITSLEFEGDAASYLTAAGCEGAVLAEQAQCTITLQFAPESAPESATTHLVIHQNFRGPATRVPVEAHGEVAVEPNLGLGPASCDLSALVADPDTGTVSGRLVVDAPITRAEFDGSFEATVHINGELQWTFGVAADQQAVHVDDEYQGALPTSVMVTIDSAQTVEESSDDDNVAFC